MPRNRDEWASRVKAVEREYLAMRQAADRFRQAATDDPTILQGDIQRRDIVSASTNLEATYIVRLFAEFETGARQYWAANWGTDPRTADLINGLAARRRIPESERDNAQLVREYRNALVHEREDKPDEVPISLARRYLCQFFGRLPQEW